MTEIELLMKWYERTSKAHIAHYNAASRFDHLHYSFGLIVIIVSSLVSSLNDLDEVIKQVK